MSQSIPAKDVDAVNTIKKDLKHYVEKIAKIESANSSYWEHYKKILDLLINLGKMEINVATLHVTKIGKIMTKYERELPKELSDVAKENNKIWKSLLNKYRETFKKRVYSRISQVTVKEELLSQDSYNELLASQDQSNYSQESCNALLANSPDFDNIILEIQTGAETALNHDSESNNSDPSKHKDTSKDFLVDMRNVVLNVTKALSSVEVECNKMKTMIEYINDKLDDYERNLHKTISQHTSSSRNVTSNPKNINIRESFEKTGRAVMPCLLSPSRKTIQKTNDNHNFKKSTGESATSIKPAVSYATCTYTSTTQLAASPIYQENLKNSYLSKEVSDGQPSSKNKQQTIDNELNKISPKAASSGKATSSCSVKYHKSNHKKLPSSLLSTTGNITATPDNVTIDTGKAITIGNSTVTTDIADISSYVISEDSNPCTSSNYSDNNNTSMYPIKDITIKQEDPDDSQNIEFYRHSDNSSNNTPNVRNNDCIEIISKQRNVSTSAQKMKRKSFEERDAIPNVVNSDSIEIHDKISNISQKLKRRSFEEKDNITKKSKNVTDKNSLDITSSTMMATKLSGNSSEEEEGGTNDILGKSCRLTERSLSIISSMVNSSPVSPEKQNRKSSVFEIDSDGFAVPQMLTQNVINNPDDNTVILKGAEVQGDVGVNLDDVELESFYTFSQTVDDMEDEIDDIEKDYLLANKKNRTSWNKSCKSREGIKYSPLLVKTKGRMKAAHKSSVGKEVVHNMLNKNKTHK